jgi:spermidine/putrescine transport system permease protein
MNRSLPWLLWSCAVLVYGLLYAPLVVVLVYSFNSARHGGPWQGFTTAWYVKLLRVDATASGLTEGERKDAAGKRLAVQNTLVLATVSTAVATVVGTLLGYGLWRYQFPGKHLGAWLLYLPVVVPDIVMAVALLLFFALLRQGSAWLFGVLGYAWPELFTLGMGTMILAHVTFQIPFVAIVVRARLAGLDPAIEEAARDLGANAWQTFWRITMPLMLPGVLAGGLLAFTLSLDDFVVSFFTTGPGATTVPILIYSSVRRGITPDINALSTLLVLASILGTVGITLLQRRRPSL